MRLQGRVRSENETRGRSARTMGRTWMLYRPPQKYPAIDLPSAAISAVRWYGFICEIDIAAFSMFLLGFFFLKISGILSKSQHVGRSVCKFNPAPHVWLSHEGTVAFFLRHHGQKRGRFVYLFDLNRPHPMPFKSQHECGIRRVQLRLIFGSMAAFIWPSS